MTTKPRGLIVRVGGGADGDIIARPFIKFFNYNEHPEGTFDLDAQVLATDKVDCSLGILYPHPKGGWATATRGSFHSEQAIRGTEILHGYIAKGFAPNPAMTYLFEIIYPENRIVVDYGDLEDLIPLACYHTERGEPAGLGDPFPEEIYARFNPPATRGGTLRDVLALPPRPNAEGWVVRFEDGTRVKVKQDSYVALHRIVTGLNKRTVWEHMVKGGSLDELLEPLPDELHTWTREVWADFDLRVLRKYFDALIAHQACVSALPEGFPRGDYALLAKGYADLTPYLFNLLDGRDPRPRILAAAKPGGI